MAALPQELKVTLSDEFSAALKETREELLAAKEMLSEARIRQIVQEELADWEKSFVQRIRTQIGIRLERSPLTGEVIGASLGRD